MRKKLLAGVMALALCSTNMPQTIFAGEFTSGNLEEVTEETPEVAHYICRWIDSKR